MTETSRRQGTALFAALICVLVVSMFGAVLVRRAVSRQRQVRDDERRLQAFWIAESACERALFRLHSEDDYQGETWTIAADQLDQQDAGRAEIQIIEDDASPGGLIIRVRAAFPSEGSRTFSSDKELRLSRRATGESP